MTNVMLEQKSAKERILEVAGQLFYENGMKATGINEIIAKSGVAKATFYTHFPSKDELMCAYMVRRHEEDFQGLRGMVAQGKTPLEKFLAPVAGLEAWMKQSRYKGCAFLNAVPEVRDPEHPVRKISIKHYDACTDLIKGAAVELIASDKKKYGHLKAAKLAEDYMVIFSGAIALAEIHHRPEHIRKAVELIKDLVR